MEKERSIELRFPLHDCIFRARWPIRKPSPSSIGPGSNVLLASHDRPLEMAAVRIRPKHPPIETESNSGAATPAGTVSGSSYKSLPQRAPESLRRQKRG